MCVMRKSGSQPNIRRLALPLTELGKDEEGTGDGRRGHIELLLGQFKFEMLPNHESVSESVHQGRGRGQEFRGRGWPWWNS